MKKLIVSMKATDEMFDDFKKVANKIKKGKSPKNPHYEISFESEKDFNRFIKNIKVIMVILHHQPKSIYDLAKICDRDLANVKKILKFFEEVGAIRFEQKTSNGRRVKMPVVDYSRIEFDLQAA